MTFETLVSVTALCYIFVSYSLLQSFEKNE
jgi:hypothetical protein